MNLADLIKTYRIEKGLSVKKASKLLNVSRSYLSNIESGRRKKPSLEILKSISELYEIDYKELLTLTNQNHIGSNKSEKYKKIETSNLEKEDLKKVLLVCKRKLDSIYNELEKIENIINK